MIVTALSFAFGSCKSVKEVAYFQPSDTVSANSSKVVYPNFPQEKAGVSNTPVYEAIIQPNDILSIFVNSLSPEGSSFFNAVNQGVTNSIESNSVRPDVGYMVDVNGLIDMPLIGKVKLGGLTTKVAHDTLVNRLEQYLQSPTVRLFLANYKVTLLGEVTHPGVFTINNEKISLPQALGLAGALTIFGNRKDVLVIREENGQKTFNKIDLTKRDLFNSPFYYLHSNDIVYVEPVKGKVASTDNFYRLFPVVMSGLTLIGVILLNTR